MKATGNTLLITGGTAGIGLGMALRFWAAGNRVVVAGRREDVLDRIAADHPGLGTVVLDVTDPVSIARAARTLAETHPELNVLVNNAGVMAQEDLLDASSVSVAEAHVTTNLLGPVRTTYAFLPQLLRNDDPVVVNVTSALGFVPWAATPTYSATKAALHSFTQSLRVQLADRSVQVVEVVPPAVRTTLMGQQDDPDAMPLEEFLDEALGLLHSDRDVEEVVVRRAEFARYAEATGTHRQVLAMLSGVTR
ncbi:SDR family NAD(P)-dependent oxidoreductase [Kineococcus sp. NPDC059986]|uniref:SDR family oxidoreductase n=1 Tax=Kineococcus sp. NPDC059986 TaxID=3155538 RepID=UPI00344D4B1E